MFLSSIVGTALLGVTVGTQLGSQLGHHNHASFGGDYMERTFTSYVDLPLGATALQQAGWTKHGTSCDSNLGFAWTQDKNGPTESQPLTLFTTAAGQPSGVGYMIRGRGAHALPKPQMRWATAHPIVGSDEFPNAAHVAVAFRSGDIICSGQSDPDVPIGDTLIVNPGGMRHWPWRSQMTLPLTESGAQHSGFKRGSCFDGMGWHYFLDTFLHNGELSWKAKNVFPIVTMYHRGEINAIFFASTVDQVSTPITAANEWDPLALSNEHMCGNLCDSACTFSGLPAVGPWSTAHIYFRNHTEVTCASDLTCGITSPFRGNCCDAVSSVSV
jgi:hypothetical protein